MSLRSILYSILIHLGVAGLLAFSFDFPAETITPQRPPANIVNAVAVDEQQVQAELDRLEEKERQKEKAERQRKEELKRIEKERRTEEQRLAELKKQQQKEAQERKAEQQRLAEMKKQQEELERRRELEEQRKLEAEKERRRIEEEKRKAEEEKRRAEAEKKRLEEEKRRAEAEKQRIEEARRKAEEERRRREAEEALKEQLEAEQRAAEAAQARADQKVVNQYGARIQEAIRRQFNTVGLPEGLSCVLQIRTVPGGDVVEVRVVQSSGNSIFDRRAETAVNKASPLPVPDNMRIFEKMREIRLTFAPQG